ncbi:MAG: hypothetical protein IJP92_15175 [Lachnospiraceae bacterium]|nr:hypothetical protein [Lachnospiraceae bacterium]
MQKRRRLSLLEKKTVAGVLIAIAAILLIAGFMIWRRFDHPPFVYTEHLEDVIVTVDAESVTLRDFGCYVYETEGYVQRQALIYDEEEPVNYWNMHLSAGMDSTFMFDYAMKTALGTLVCDLVYAGAADAEGITLSAEAKEKAREDALFLLKGMSEAQQKILGITETDVIRYKERKALSALYAASFADKTDLRGYGGAPAQVLSYDGDYFLKVILPQHEVTYNEDLIENVRMGTVTVNLSEKEEG